MSAHLSIPRDTIALQAKASDPQNSVWVSANAGSGKTHVLAQRVTRLLLEGTDPSKILCLTYTRAAAANMANRVFSTLGEWAMLDETTLSARIQAIEGRRPNAGKLRRARQLFAKALETPGGLKIQTIHAFCEALLHQFPLEANIAGHFEMLDSRMEAALVATARRELIAGAASPHDERLANAFATVLERGGEAGLDALLTEIIRLRDPLRAFIDEIGNDPVPYSALFEEFGYRPEDTAQDIAAGVWPLAEFGGDYLADVSAAARAASADRTLKYLLDKAARAFAETDPVLRLRALADAFLNDRGEPYSTNWLFKKALCDAFPDLPERYGQAATSIAQACERLALFLMLETSHAALIIADWLIGRYERLKSARGFLDFNDLITRTVRLLARQDAGPWVQYKLDKGIDHILIDEAQDTSPDQWNVVKKIAEEFFAGASARDQVRRTIFAVGDEKQSIYSFQGADPESFALSGTEFSRRVREAQGKFEPVRLTWSFRSTEDVLSAVDLVFSREEVRKGLTRDPDTLNHKPIRSGVPGYVEVWPSLGAEAVEEPDDWTLAVDHARAPAVRVAENIAQTVAGWLQGGEMLRTRQGARHLRAGDILVLVRKRDRFVHALSRALKNRNIPVAGADRISLPAHIAVKDLAALGHFLLQPDDDLSLAAVLKSPIFGLSEENLFSLCWNRPEGSSLYAELQRRAEHDPSLAAILSSLRGWASEAAFKPVFDFYAALLGRDGVRSRMVRRLGHEAGDILDEFLNFCLAEEQTGLPGLEAFLATLESAGPEVKREMDQTRDEVRIMTVHASKGLEAPVVFLVDGGAAPFSDQHLPRLMPFRSRSSLWQGGGFLWRAGAETKNAFSRRLADGIREKAEEEYRRLLYVGMTRAENRLVVCGYHGKRAQSGSTWHAIVQSALAASPYSRQEERQEIGIEALRYQVTPEQGMLDLPLPEAAPGNQDMPPPADLFSPVAEPPSLPRPLSPSGALALIEPSAETVIANRSPVLDDVKPSLAVERGLAVHRLLQVLPELPAEQAEAAAERYLERTGANWSAEERSRALGSVLAILRDPIFAPLFGAESRAEVAVTGSLTIQGRHRLVSGKVDRLAVTDAGVMIVDYKSNRPPPLNLDEVPPAYILQMALYRALLQSVYPGRRVEAALLFTEAPRLLPLPASLLEQSLARLTQA